MPSATTRLRLQPAICKSLRRNCRDATDLCSNPKRATLLRRREYRSGDKPLSKGKGATPRPSRIRRVGEFHEARVTPSAARRPERVVRELFGAEASSSGKIGSWEWGVGNREKKITFPS